MRKRALRCEIPHPNPISLTGRPGNPQNTCRVFILSRPVKLRWREGKARKKESRKWTNDG